MHIRPPDPLDTQRAAEVGHEPNAVSVGGVGWFFAVLILSTAVVHVVIWEMYQRMASAHQSQDVQRSALASMRAPPPQPWLQPSRYRDVLPKQDLGELRDRENAEFDRRGWTIDQHGIRQIPDETVSQVLHLSAAPSTAPAQGAAR